MKLKISSRNISLAGFVAVLAAAAILFGVTGARTVLAIAVFFFLPFYLILRAWNLEADEKVLFAFFIGLGLFSGTVFYFGRVIPSYRVSLILAFIFLLLLPFIAKKFKK